MTNVFYLGPEHVQAACLKALWTYLPTIYDSGSLLYNSPIAAPMPTAPGVGALEGLENCYPTVADYYARGLVDDAFAFPVPSVIVDVREGEQVDWFDDQRQLWRIPVTVWYTVGIDASTQTPTNAVAMGRQTARAGALAAQTALMRYVAPIARGIDATYAWGISHAERGGLANAEAPFEIDNKLGRQQVHTAFSTVYVYQMQGAAWSVAAGTVGGPGIPLVVATPAALPESPQTGALYYVTSVGVTILWDGVEHPDAWAVVGADVYSPGVVEAIGFVWCQTDAELDAVKTAIVANSWEVSSNTYGYVSDTGASFAWTGSTWQWVATEIAFADSTALDTEIAAALGYGWVTNIGCTVSLTAGGVARFTSTGGAYETLAGGGDLGDANVWEPASYTATPDAAQADGDYQIPADTTSVAIVWKRAAGTWAKYAGTARQELGAIATGARVSALVDDGEITVHEGAAYASVSGSDLVIAVAPGQRFTMSVDVTTWVASQLLARAWIEYTESTNGAADDWGIGCGLVTDTGSLDLATRLILYGGGALGIANRWCGSVNRVDSLFTTVRRSVEKGDAFTSGTDNSVETFGVDVFPFGASTTVTGVAGSATSVDTYAASTRRRVFIQVANRAGSTVDLLTATLHTLEICAS